MAVQKNVASNWNKIHLQFKTDNKSEQLIIAAVFYCIAAAGTISQ